MRYETFTKLLLEIQRVDQDLSALHDIGLDLFEGKYKISTSIEKMHELMFREFYNDDGIEWIYWFIYESKFGSDPRLTAHDANNKPICYDFESLWYYLRENCQRK